MSLLTFQAALARRVMAAHPAEEPPGGALSNGEAACLDDLCDSAGLNLTRKVQRSWCEFRAADAARVTLSVLAQDTRQALITRWVEDGGGAASFAATQGEAFLGFIARTLPEPSAALTLCRVEQAVARLAAPTLEFAPPDAEALAAPIAAVRISPAASLIAISADAGSLIAALVGQDGLAPSGETGEVLFAPGLAKLCRPATAAEIALWRDLAAPARVDALLRLGHAPVTLEDLLRCGALEPAAVLSA